jgi:hypothetical protein
MRKIAYSLVSTFCLAIVCWGWSASAGKNVPGQDQRQKSAQSGKYIYLKDDPTRGQLIREQHIARINRLLQREGVHDLDASILFQDPGVRYEKLRSLIAGQEDKKNIRLGGDQNNTQTNQSVILADTVVFSNRVDFVGEKLVFANRIILEGEECFFTATGDTYFVVNESMRTLKGGIAKLRGVGIIPKGEITPKDLEKNGPRIGYTPTNKTPFSRSMIAKNSSDSDYLRSIFLASVYDLRNFGHYIEMFEATNGATIPQKESDTDSLMAEGTGCFTCANGANGADGANGFNGDNGLNGSNGSTGQNGIDFIFYWGWDCSNGFSVTWSSPGTNGGDGAPGQTGQSGVSGAPGTDGYNGQDCNCAETGGTSGGRGGDGGRGGNGGNGGSGGSGGNGGYGGSGGNLYVYVNCAYYWYAENFSNGGFGGWGGSGAGPGIGGSGGSGGRPGSGGIGIGPNCPNGLNGSYGSNGTAGDTPGPGSSGINGSDGSWGNTYIYY